jgi:peptide chain release factor 1
LTELQQILDDPESDQELRIIAAEEIDGATEIVGRVSTELKKTLVPIHPFEHLPCLLELRPGAGGSEAALFAGDLLRMYQAFCRQRGLRSTIISLDDAEGGGNESMIHEAIVEIDGEGAYGLLRCEAGVHRVQRVPATEKQGRTHTSAVSVIVLPSFPENSNDSPELSIDDPSSDYYIDPTDVRTDVYRSRGAGGQHVNTTDSAVRLTHVPTNTVVAMQESRSQQKNRSKAWQILRSRLAQARREAREEEIAKIRVGVVGVAKMGRGDKIRTYNWGQQRVTDHRSGYTAHNLDDVLDGGEGLEEVMKSVKGWLMERELEALGAEEEMKAKEGNKS